MWLSSLLPLLLELKLFVLLRLLRGASSSDHGDRAPVRASCALSASAGRSSAKIRAPSGDDCSDDCDDDCDEDARAGDDGDDNGWREPASRRSDEFEDALKRDVRTSSHSVAMSAPYGCEGSAIAAAEEADAGRNHDEKNDDDEGGGGVASAAAGDAGALSHE